MVSPTVRAIDVTLHERVRAHDTDQELRQRELLGAKSVEQRGEPARQGVVDLAADRERGPLFGKALAYVGAVS